MILALDHVVILVRDLAVAVADYEALGFRVTPGGTHADGLTHNALVSFADGAYLELLAFTGEAPGHRWWRHVADGEGLIDFALLPGQIEADVAAARARGLALTGPRPGGRDRPDGVRLEWQTAFGDSPDLPFLCGDVTARELRVPQGEAWRHSNGVTGVFRVTVAVRDLEASAARYSALLGLAPIVEPHRRLFKLGASYLALQTPGADGLDQVAVAARLAARGEGLAALSLRRDNIAAVPRTLDAELSHGVRMTVA